MVSRGDRHCGNLISRDAIGSQFLNKFMNTRKYCPFVCIVILSAWLTGCSGSKQASDGDQQRPKIAFVTNGVASFWVLASKGVEKAGREFDVDTETVMPTGGSTDQQRILEDLVSRGFDGIAVSPIDPENQTGLIDTISGYTNVITQDGDAPKSKRLAYIGTDNYDAGRLCGELVVEAIPEGGKVAIFIGRLGQDNARRRRQGVIDTLMDREPDADRFDPPGATPSNDRYRIIGTYTDGLDQSVAKSNVEDVLSRHPDVDAMVGLFAYNPVTILEAVRQAGKIDEIKIIGFDEADQTLQGIIDGEIYGTSVQNPLAYGRESVRVLAGLSRGKTLDELGFDQSRIMHIPARKIKRDEVEAFWADLRRNLEPSTDPAATSR